MLTRVELWILAAIKGVALGILAVILLWLAPVALVITPSLVTGWWFRDVQSIRQPIADLVYVRGATVTERWDTLNALERGN